MTVRLLTCFLIVSSIGIHLFWSCKDQTKENEKKQISSSHFLNPNQCASCHKEIVESYLQTGKGRSFYPASVEKSFEDWTVLPVYDKAMDFYYLPYRVDSSFFIREFRLENGDTIHKRTEKIDFFIGSGNQTRSYLFQRNQYLFEMPVTWYSHKKIWDLSPGYEKGGNYRFEREVGDECMACHNSGFEVKPWSINRYSDFGNALSCESCHGNLDNHLNSMLKTNHAEKDPTVLKLGKLPVQAQMDVCRNCHLEGVKVRREKAKSGDYQPGKLFSDYYEVFIPATGDQDFGFASHAERLQLSACFAGSKGTMTCVTCHNPHSSIPENPTEFFNQKCLSCHQASPHQKSCSKTATTNKADIQHDNCISCHLQKAGTSDIPHVSSTDHWIRKQPGKPSGKSETIRFRNFAGASVTDRDKGNAYLQFAESRSDSNALKEVAQFLQNLGPDQKIKYHYLKGSSWLSLKDTGLFIQSGNPWTLFYGSQLRKASGLPYQTPLLLACEKAPDMVEFQYRLALANEESGSTENAYKKVLELNPFHSKSLSNLGFRALQNKDYPKAETLLSKSLVQDPDFVLAQENLALCYLEQGKFEQSRKILRRLIIRFPTEARYQQALQSIP